jgi:thioredoxin reductase
MPAHDSPYDVIIIGAGPAGLSAALILGRCRRRVLVVDSGEPRNAASRALHGYLTRDGITPQQLRQIGRDELRQYPSVEVRDATACEANRVGDHFEIALRDAPGVRGRFLLLATGRVDRIPDLPGFRKFYGRGVYHCPYCDGWEHRDQHLVVYGGDEGAAGTALDLLTWSALVTVCTDGKPEWSRDARAQLDARSIAVRTEKVSGLDGSESLARVLFDTGDALPTRALFFSSECTQRSALPRLVGCEFDRDNSVVSHAHAVTNVPGVFVAGNVRGGLHLAIAAAAEGAEAAIAINNALLAL